MKKRYWIAKILTFFMVLVVGITEITYAQPKISNCDISPKEIGHKDEVTISFDYENVAGGLKEAKAILTQKVQMSREGEVFRRVSNWQVHLTNLSAYSSEFGRFEKNFINEDIWRGPTIEFTYEIKIIDTNGKESNICVTKIRPK
jgi:hypothetical protein